MLGKDASLRMALRMETCVGLLGLSWHTRISQYIPSTSQRFLSPFSDRVIRSIVVWKRPTTTTKGQDKLESLSKAGQSLVIKLKLYL
jgi:hypothetical protein